MSETAPSSAKPRVQYAWYGDDFTGSTDVLEALALYAVSSVLFTDIPSDRELAAFSHCRAIGIAGESRSRTPEWMDKHLPPVFEAMRRLRAPVNHYKVCSTFDSSPQSGSIGRAMELGLRTFDSVFVPIVVTAPHLSRAVVFGNLFAAAHGEMHRIDRHPTMRCHPVTPMMEADLRLHLAEQTSMSIALMDLIALRNGTAAQRLDNELKAGTQAMLFDGISYAELDVAAELILKQSAARPVFAVGSSGLTYGILRGWRSAGLAQELTALAPPAATEKIVVLSGSCSPVTAAQILDAQQRGFSAFRLHGGAPWRREIQETLKSLAAGQSVVLYTALGPESSAGDHGAAFSMALGDVLQKILLASGVRRVVIAGGDTSSHAVKQLGPRALTFAAPLVPGAPLCRLWSPGSALDGVEVVLKGGQVGPVNFFSQVRDGL